jgi:hypothetical protein
MSFDIDDLMRIDENGKGYVNILRLTDIQDKPKLFSTHVEYASWNIPANAQKRRFRPAWISDFIDEAHLIFAFAKKPFWNKLKQL